MGEQIDLTTPEVKPANTAYHLERLTMDFDAGTIYVQLKGVNGESRSRMYDKTTTPSGPNVLKNLITGDYSVVSMVRFIYGRIKIDEGIAGTISGVPQ